MFKEYQARRKEVKAPPEFGEDIRSQEFHLESGITFMNCAARGVTPKQVLAAVASKSDKIESNNDWYYFFDKETDLPAATQVLAEFLSCDSNDLSFVENTTRGLNNMIKTANVGHGEAILQNIWTYGPVKNINSVMARDKGVEILQIEHRWPIGSSEEIIQQYRDMFTAHNNIKLVIVDHISSNPAILYPVREVIDLCHQNGALVLVDGAHAVGHIDVNLTELGADFYAGNANKWMFGPKNCAFQWVAPAFHGTSEPVVTHNQHLEDFPLNMFKQGTRNDAPYLAYPAAVDFYNWIGGLSAITAYNVGLMEEGMALLLEAWQTPKFPIPSEMEAPFIRMTIVPDTLAYPQTEEGANRLRDDIAERFHVMVAVSYRQGELLIRVSVQVFVVLDDFVRLRDAVMILKDEDPDDPRQLSSKAKPHSSAD